ncbi:MAG: hypothetical protein K6A14_02805 [Erysipelotrichaceae bacterium]|nr:hypothetical protein [Erysipelotrichaceae bacterium]
MSNNIEYKYLDQTPIRIKIKKASSLEDTAIIIDSITLWKTNRQIEFSGNAANELNKQLHQITKIKCVKDNKDLIREVTDNLMNLKGIRLPMASTILNFYNDLLPICDQRAYREAYAYDNREYPFTLKELRKYHKGLNRKANYVDLYMDYIDRCYELTEELTDCVFILNGVSTRVDEKNIDKYLYAVDESKKKPVKH